MNPTLIIVQIDGEWHIRTGENPKRGTMSMYTHVVHRHDETKNYGIDIKAILNGINDFFVKEAKDNHYGYGKSWLASWTGIMDELVQDKGTVQVVQSPNHKVPFTFDEIVDSGFFDDKPGLYVPESDFSSISRDITVTPWRPEELQPILLRLPQRMDDASVSQFVRMFMVGPITEIRWQRGHVTLEDKKYVDVQDKDVNAGLQLINCSGIIVRWATCYNGNGHYVKK